MTKLIAAYPCLGKTTLSKWNRTSIFDREFNESRSIIGMSTEQIQLFFKACADIICLQLQTNTYEILFITENERLLMELNKRGIKPILIFPDAFDSLYMMRYKENVIKRSGLDWWNRVLASEIPTLPDRILESQALGYDVRLTNTLNPYIENVIEMPAILESTRNMAKEKKKELLPGYHWECKYCDGRLAKQSPYEEKKFMVCASCGAEWEDCKIPVPDESIW